MSAPEEGAARLLEGFADYRARFGAITARAGRRFARREWPEGQRDAARRLRLYDRCLGEAIERVRRAGEAGRSQAGWRRMKEAYARLADDRRDAEVAKTFFNSVCRRVLGTVGVRPEVEFLGGELGRPEGCLPDGPYLSYRAGAPSTALVRRILADLPLEAPFEDLGRDAALVARTLLRRPPLRGPADGARAFEFLPSLFYRNKGAYLVGRVRWERGVDPVVLALLNGEEGVRVDAVLTDSDEVSVVFGFSRSYFQVETRHTAGTVAFLRSILPRKRTDELYTAIGHHRHGKTELYRALRDHLRDPDATFRVAPGQPGTVMCAFTLDGLDVVFKVIRDRIAPPKRVSRREVREKYRLVFVRDRVGRLTDAQQFEGLTFHCRRFVPELLEELRETAPRTVRIREDRVVIGHLYTERRMTPLDLYLRSVDPERALEAVLDYGRAIRDLAAAGIFPGDLLLKNFGVSRHGRVIFYDYDELCLLSEPRFRNLPSLEGDGMPGAEPIYGVGASDVFPEEWPRFLGIPRPLKGEFLEAHGEIFTAAFWQRMQEVAGSGEVLDFFPYPAERRLRGTTRSPRSLRGLGPAGPHGEPAERVLPAAAGRRSDVAGQKRQR